MEAAGDGIGVYGRARACPAKIGPPVRCPPQKKQEKLATIIELPYIV